MKKINLLILAIIIALSSFAQVAYENRIEIEAKNGYTQQSISEFGNKGFLMSSRTVKPEKGKLEWKYELYNTNLEIENTASIYIDKGYYKDETLKTDEYSHTLFRNKDGKYVLISVEISTLEITKIEGSIPKKVRLYDMAILKDFTIFIAKAKKESYLMAVNWKTGKQIVIPIVIDDYSSKQISISNFQILEDANEVFAYVKVKLAKGVSELYVVKLNDQGEKEDVFKLESKTGENFVSVSASKVGEDHYVFTGTYSTSHVYSSEGLFFLNRSEGENVAMTFKKFTELDDFLSYLPERMVLKYEKKKKKKEEKGKEYTLNYRISVHEIQKVDDGYIFLGEAYYATYRTETYTTTDANGHSTTQTRRVFDGYQYTHAVIVKFDEEGELLWDKTFVMRPMYKPYFPKRFISISKREDNSMDMVFADYGRIVSKSIDYDEGMVAEERDATKIETNRDGDETKYTFSNVDYWYDNYFIAYGFQVIKNISDESKKKKRKIFFISKIEYK